MAGEKELPTPGQYGGDDSDMRSEQILSGTTSLEDDRESSADKLSLRETSEPRTASRRALPAHPAMLKKRSISAGVPQRAGSSFSRRIDGSFSRRLRSQPSTAISQIDKVAILASYSPRMVIERFQKDMTPPSCPMQTVFYGAVVFVDVSGFTKLSESLAEHYGTKQGAEKLNEYINEYFRLLIDAILDAGGDIIKFAGDALQVIWRVPEPPADASSECNSGDRTAGGRSGGGGSSQSSSSSSGTASAAGGAAAAAGEEAGHADAPISATMHSAIAEQLLVASRCCLSMLDNFHGFSPTHGVALKLHMGIGAGRLMAYTVGGHLSKW